MVIFLSIAYFLSAGIDEIIYIYSKFCWCIERIWKCGVNGATTANNEIVMKQRQITIPFSENPFNSNNASRINSNRKQKSTRTHTHRSRRPLKWIKANRQLLIRKLKSEAWFRWEKTYISDVPTKGIQAQRSVSLTTMQGDAVIKKCFDAEETRQATKTMHLPETLRQRAQMNWRISKSSKHLPTQHKNF